MKPWVVPILVAVVLWGIAAFLRKKAVLFLPPQSAVTFEALDASAVILLLFALSGGHLVKDPRGVLFAVYTGIFAVAGTLFMFYALKNGPVSIVTSFSAVAVVITVILGVLLLHEKLLLHQVAGIALGIVPSIPLIF